MAANTTKFLDLDAIAAEVTTFVIKLGGVEHALVPTSVKDWIINTKAIQALKAVEGDIEVEVDAMIAMIQRAFPTTTTTQLKALPLASLNKILAFARSNDGSEQVEAEATADATTNPPVTPAPESTLSTSASSSPA